MKILYAIQGTGNGHISRAKEIIPHLEKHGALDILISGTEFDVKLSQPIKYQLHGFSFVFGKNGGVHHYKTWLSMNLFQLRRDIKKLNLEQYDLIVNDFEPVTAWACKLRGIESVSLSHQASFKSKKVPRPKTIDWGKLILSHYAPTTHHLGFHFSKFDSFIHTPIIRSEIRSLIPQNLGHYTVYLPAVDDKHLVKILSQVPEIEWQVFSKHISHDYAEGNVIVEPINNERFIKSLANCEGLFTGGGFEGPAEALFLGKKVLVSPMKFQFEQQCNAYALKQMGLPVIWGSTKNWLPILKKWVESPQHYQFDFPDETEKIVDDMVKKYARRV